jgi:hypothetical protein
MKIPRKFHRQLVRRRAQQAMNRPLLAGIRRLMQVPGHRFCPNREANQGEPYLAHQHLSQAVRPRHLRGAKVNLVHVSSSV